MEMAKVTLKNPASYFIAGVRFERGKAQIVSDKVAEVCEKLEHFVVEYAEDIRRMAEAKVRTAIKRPSDEDAFVAQVIDAAKQLNPRNSEHYTKAGKPQVSALTELLGYPVSAQERDDIFGASGENDPNKPVETAAPDGTKVVETQMDEADPQTGATIRITRREKVNPEKGDLTTADVDPKAKPADTPVTDGAVEV